MMPQLLIPTIYKRHSLQRALTLVLFGLTLSGLVDAQVPGRNINMISGTQWPGGDPFLQRHNEPSMAVSTRNPLHLLSGANDYRTVDLPGIPGQPDGEENGDAWVGLFKSFDGGQTWTSTLVPGYPQDNSVTGINSPMKGFGAAADPVVRAGTNGLFYYVNLAFNRDDGAPSAIVISSFLDNNNDEVGDPIQFLGTTVVDRGADPVMVDKPWLAVDIPRNGALTCSIGNPVQFISAGNVYVVYSAFVNDDLHGRIMFARSRDCGATWSAPVQIADSSATNQGATVAVDPNTGTVYVGWRRFAGANTPDAIMFSSSADFGQTFSPPSAAAIVSPFDQATSTVSFRTNSYPTMAVDGTGRIYLAWAQRGAGPGGDARIVLSTSTTGQLWSAPAPVDNPATRGHQIMPAMTFAAGKLALVYYDLSEDTTDGIYTSLGGGQFQENRVPIGDLASIPPHPEKVFTTSIMDAPPTPGLGPLLRRHTIDLRVAEASAGAAPTFTSAQVSQYPIGSRPGSVTVEQLQMNVPNLPMFALGTAPFIGDYLDVAALTFVHDTNGNWIFNTSPSSAPVFHTVWTDNRDVRPPLDGIWAHYTPPQSSSSQPLSIFDPTQPQPACQIGQSGDRSQHIYTSTISAGLVAQSPGNSKPLTATFPRAFVITVQNTTSAVKPFRLTIANQPPGGRASFTQVRSSSSTAVKLDVSVPAFSTIARSVFVQSPITAAQVRVDIAEITAPGGTVVTGGLQSSVFLNPDSTNPVNPEISASEIYNPDVSNPDVSNPDVSNPDVSNPDVSNPDVSNVRVENPDVSNPDVSNPDVSNPDVSNPDVSNPDVSNPDVSNGAFKDVTWIVTNRGNTHSAYTIKTVLASNFPAGFKEQLIINKFYATPISSNCALALQTTTELLDNIVTPVFSAAAGVANPDVSNSAISNATLSLGPSETARVTLRVVNPNRTTNTNFDPTKAAITTITSHAANTTDFQNGITQPPVASSQILILSKSLPAAQAGAPYTTSLLSAGGATPIHWSVSAGSSLPAGLTLATNGILSGVPLVSGGFTLNVTAVDSSAAPESFTQALSISISAARPLAITSSAAPNGYPGLNYAYLFTAAGGLGGRTWVVSAGSLPAGLSLSTAGVLSGTPQALGTSTFTVMVSDSSSPLPQTASRQFTVLVTRLTMTFAVPPAGAAVGQNIPVQVKIQDSYSNGVPGLTVSVFLSSGGAPVFDVLRDYSNVNNPNGPWAYGSVADSVDSSFTRFTNSVAACQATGGECWTNAQPFPNTASIVHNTTGNTLFYGGTILQPPDVLNLLVFNSFPAVRWVAPANDTYTIAGRFTRIDTAPHPTDVSIVENNSSVLFSAPGFNDPFNPQTFALNSLTVTAGTTFDFFAGPSFDASDDSTGLAVTITGSGPALNGATTAVTDSTGTAVFSNLSITAPGTLTMSATQPSSATAVSAGFIVTP